MILTKLFNQKFFNTYGVISMSFSGWFILFLLTHFFTPEELGSYSLGLAIISPLALFFQFQIRNYYNSQIELKKLTPFYKLRLYGSLLFLIISITASLFTETALMVSIILISLYKFWEMFSEFSFAQKQKEQNIKYIGLSQMVKATLLIGTTFLVSKFTRNYNYFLSSITFIYFFCSVIDLKNTNLNLIKLNNHSKSVSLNSLLPLSLSALLISFNINIPKYLLEFHLGTKYVGIFTTLFVFYNLAMVLSNSIIQVWINKFSQDAKSYKSHRKNIIYSLFIIFGISAVFILSNFLFGELIYRIIFPETLHKYAPLISHLNYLIPLGLLATLTNYKLISQNNYKELFTNQIVLILSHFALSFYLIKKYNLSGGFVAFSIILGIHFILNLRIVLKRLRSLK